MTAKFFINPISTWEVLECLGSALADFESDLPVTGCHVHSEFGTDKIELSDTTPKALSTHQQWLDKIQYFKDRPYLDATKISLTTNLWSIACGVPQETKSGLELALTVNDQAPAANELIRRLADTLSTRFTIVPRSRLGAQVLPEMQLAGFRLAETTVAALATETAKISKGVIDGLQEFTVGVKERTLDLEERFQERANEQEKRFSEKHDELDRQYADKKAELERAQYAHAESVKQFELRNNTAVRRDLLEKIRTIMEEQKTIKISDETSHKRRLVHALCASTMVFSASIIAVFVVRLYQATGVDWKLFIPLSAWTVVFVTTGIYYIKWNDNWFRDHARAEFETRKLSADVLRASWVAELLFEWAEKKEISMPSELIRSFTKNLFEPTALDGRFHPSDQLDDFLKEIASLEVGKGGAKFTRQGKNLPS